MSKVVVRNAEKGFLERIQEAGESIRKRAYGFFEQREGAKGNDLEDWLRAEAELFFMPESEIRETDHGFDLTVVMEGFKCDQIEVTANPDEIIVWAASGDENESRSMYRRFALASPIDPAQVRGDLAGDTLVIDAPKPAEVPALAKSASA